VELAPSTGKAWTSAFADALIDLAKNDSRIIGITAAMADGTGLAKFEKAFPDRFIDAGICESHAVGVAAGLCKSGMRPVTAIYSTFMQRAFDQVWQETVLNGLPVIFCMDRAGFVGDDGAVHHGFMDQAFLRPLPGMVLMAPSDEAELARSLKLALTLETPAAIRYPRDTVPTNNFEQTIEEDLRADAAADWQLGQSRTLRTGTDATIIVYGALAQHAMEAAVDLADEEISVAVIDARFCKPVDGEMLRHTLRPGHAVLTVEDHSIQNGFSAAVLDYAAAHNLPTANLVRLGMPDRFVAHATRAQQLAEVGLDAAGIARAARDAVRAARKPAAALVR
jgi:1-deoxy-D-xylulose-5-phosphate synthase